MSKDRSPETGLKPSMALIAGPTASGKSECAVRLAETLAARGQRAVVLNADSAQVYADLSVLSARPTAQEMRGVEHRLFGTWDGAKACSAADWAAAARREIATLHGENVLPILVGGTGLYIRTLFDGIAPVPEIDPVVRATVRALPVSEAYEALTNEDPERAVRLGPTDSARIARALEVIRSTGHPLAHWQSCVEGGISDAVDLQAIVLSPERNWLYARCDARFTRMIEQGAVAEVEALLERNLDLSLPIMRAIGITEINAYLRGECSLAEAITRGQQATRNYAKRQFTWMRHQSPPDWPRVAPEDVLNGIKDILLFQ